MGHDEVEIGCEYIWRPGVGQSYRVTVTKAPEMIHAGASRADVVWVCKIKVQDSVFHRPDWIAFVTDLHEE